MTVPYSFGTATSAIPLSQLDSNFNTPITLGNTAIQLGNTVTTLNNMTLANVTISSGNVTLTNVSVTTANVATANIATSIITSSETLSYGTANGVAYLNGSKVVTTGSALVFDGTNLGIGTSSPTGKLQVKGTVNFEATNSTNVWNLYTFTDNTLRWNYNGAGADELVFDSSGNLGLGVTPSANQGQRSLNVGNYNGTYTAVTAGASGNGYGAIGYNVGFTSTTNSYKALSADYMSWINFDSGAFKFFQTGSVAAGSTQTGTQAMTLDASGNLGIGTTSPSVILDVQSASPIVKATATTGTNTASFRVVNTGGTSYFARDSSTGGFTGTAYATFVWGSGAYPMVFATNDIERARITSGGDLLVGTTSAAAGSLITNNGSYHQYGNQMNYQSSSSTIEFVNRNSGGAKTFSWYYEASGGGSPATLSTSGVWTNASDARGKENIADIKYGLTTVLGLKPRQYDVKSDGSHAIGFVAQEVLPIIPELVHVTKREGDDEFYGLDYGSMTAVLVKAIQEQQALIETLTARITALEAK